jgi:probable phosphoglycerate mutase
LADRGELSRCRFAILTAVMRRLLLVRHGESTWNAEHRLQGQADPPLSEHGREQSAALLPFLDGIPDHRLSSDLTRAVETAMLLGLAGTPTEERWREIDMGPWAGFTVDELDPERVAAWRRGEYYPAEQWADFQARVGGAADELRGDDVLVVTHGGCIRAATAHLTGADPRRLAPPANASLTVIEHGDRVRLQAYGLRAPGPEIPGIA